MKTVVMNYWITQLFTLHCGLWINQILGTIDINIAEMQYLADHLTPEECRRLVAAAHFPNFEPPNALDQAERKIPKDLSCIEHLQYWNSQAGEGKGETHEVLQHRLRQMGKTKLAEWLGKTVFHQLGVDLEKSITEELLEFVTTEESLDLPVVTLEPLVPKIEDPTSYSTLDYFCFSLAVGLSLTILSICFKLIWDKLREKIRKRKRNVDNYDIVDGDTSDSDSEVNKFDIRHYTSSSHVTT